MPGLFDPLTIRSVTLRNRIGVSPMCQYWSENGMASDWHLVHLGSRAVGGAGIVIVEATAVTPNGRISPSDAGIWSDAHVEPLIPIARFLEKHGAVAAIQLAHSGRKGSTAAPYLGAMDRSLSDAEGGFPIVAPSPLPFRPDSRIPAELTIAEILEIQAAFVAGAKRSLDAGFRWIELHGAHGYLTNEFYSPTTNKRTDQYGGTFENRIRFILETTRAIRGVWPESLPMSVRLSVTDWIDGSWTVEDSIDLAKRLKTEGVDLIDCSSGFVAPGVRYPMAPGWQVPLAEAVRKGAEIATAAVGMITEPSQADEIIKNGQADLVLLARESLRDPYWPFHAARALGQPEKVTLPTPYQYAV